MIEWSNITHQFSPGSFRLSLKAHRIDKGRRVALIGASGSGKSTLLELIAGIRVPDSGTITVGDARISHMPEAERRLYRLRTIGQIFQRPELLEHLSVLDNVMLPYFINSALPKPRSVSERVVKRLAAVGLEGFAARRVSELSAGEAQRVAFARALVVNPSVILADEPTGHLDPKTRDAIVHLMLKHSDITGATLLFVTHDHSLLSRFDDVIELETLRTTP